MRIRGGGRTYGLTMVELLIAMGILVVVFLITSSGIIGALRTQRIHEDSVNSQAKMRRIVEVLTQELRGSVLGAITDYPVPSTEQSISFALMTGDGGWVVDRNQNPNWGSSTTTAVNWGSRGQPDSLEGSPALLINSNGEALLVPEVTGVTGSGIRHSQCVATLDFADSVALFALQAVGFAYDDNSGTLYWLTMDDSSSVNQTPFAFDLSSFEIGYQYDSEAGVETLTEPNSVSFTAGNPEVRYDLARLRLSLSTTGAQGGERNNVSYVELAGMDDSARQFHTLEVCETVAPPDDGDDDDPDIGDDPGDDEPGGEDPGGGDDSGGGGGRPPWK